MVGGEEGPHVGPQPLLLVGEGPPHAGPTVHCGGRRSAKARAPSRKSGWDQWPRASAQPYSSAAWCPISAAAQIACLERLTAAGELVAIAAAIERAAAISSP